MLQGFIRPLEGDIALKFMVITLEARDVMVMLLHFLRAGFCIDKSPPSTHRPLRVHLQACQRERREQPTARVAFGLCRVSDTASGIVITFMII